MNLPRFFIVGARPVMMVATPEGGTDVLAYDWDTGDLVRNMDYAMRVMFPDGEVDEVDEAAFTAAVAQLQQDVP